MTTKQPRPAKRRYEFKSFTEADLAAAVAEATEDFKANGARGVNVELLAQIAAADIKILDLARRINALEGELANFVHRGPYRSGERYAKNNLVQFSGLDVSIKL